MKEEINNSIIETAERIVIDYANFSGRESAHRAEFREAVCKHLQSFIEAEIEHLEGIKKELSKRCDNYSEKLDEKICFDDGFSEAIDDQIYHLTQLLTKR